MVAKGDLTKILKSFREFNQEKEQTQRVLLECNQEFADHIQTQ
jgi:hypothetical protein